MLWTDFQLIVQKATVGPLYKKKEEEEEEEVKGEKKNWQVILYWFWQLLRVLASAVLSFR